MTDSSLRDHLLGLIKPECLGFWRVGVVYGGKSAEREISLRTGKALAQALRHAGWQLVEAYDFPADQARFLASPPDVVLNGLHGGMGEDGTLQGFLRVLGIPFTGSGVLASALTMDKSRAKAVMLAAGVPVPRGVLLGVRDLEPEAFLAACVTLKGDLVIKPNDGGSSVGTYLVEAGQAPTHEQLTVLIGLLEHGINDGVLAEERLMGPEYSVGFFDQFCLGAIEIEPRGEAFYDYKAKYESTATRYLVVEDEARLDALRTIATIAWKAVGGAGVGRVDVMAGEGGELHVLEVNTVPGMTATSLVPKLAASHGIDFSDFASVMVAAATTRPGQKTQEETTP